MTDQDKTHLAAGRLEYLDSIRGLAALFVLLSHTMGAFAWPETYHASLGWPFINILFNGKEAVVMFFVLSGYVLAKPYVSQLPGGNRHINVMTFYTRRGIRIWLPWFFAFVISLLVKEYWFAVPSTSPPASDWFHWFWVPFPMTAMEFIKQGLFLEHDLGRKLLNQDWSLGVELKGSLLIPLFIWGARGRRWPVNCIAAGWYFLLAYNGGYYISFIVGVMVARFDYLCHRMRAWRWLWLGAGLMLYQGFRFGESLPRWQVPAADLGWTISAVGCGLILGGVLANPTWQQCLSAGWLRFLGRISYSLYLLQFIIILAVLPHVLRIFNEIGLGGFTSYLLIYVSSVVLTLAGAALMYYLVEAKVIHLGHWLTRSKNRSETPISSLIGSK